MELLQSYDSLWIIYLVAVFALILSSYLILRSLPFSLLRWLVLVSMTVLLVSPVKVAGSGWMVPGIIYWLFERFLVNSARADSVIMSILANLLVGVVLVVCLWFVGRLFSSGKPSSNIKR